MNAEMQAILRALSGFTDYVPAKAVHNSAFPRATTPSIEGVGRRLTTLYKRGLVARSLRDRTWKYALTIDGRAAVEDTKGQEDAR